MKINIILLILAFAVFTLPVLSLGIGDEYDWSDSAYDSNSNKVVVIWRDDDNSGIGTAKVGTVSGEGASATITFGKACIFDTSTAAWSIAPIFDSYNNKVVISYRMGSMPWGGRCVVGTVNGEGTSAIITFGSYVTFSVNPVRQSIVFDSVNNKIIIASRYYPNNDQG